MRQIVIVNAKGFGEEVAAWVQLMPGFGSDFTLKGFLDNRLLHDTVLPIIGTPEHYKPAADESLVIALADPVSKKHWADRFLSMNVHFFSVVHPLNFVSQKAKIGTGAIIAPMNSISENVVLEAFVTVYGFCKIGHDVSIGKYTHVASHSSFDGLSVVGKSSFVPSFTKLNKGESFTP